MSNNQEIRVAEAIKREFGLMLLTEIKDSRLHKALTSVTEVEVTNDLRHVKILISVLGDEEQKKEVMSGLESARGFIRGELGKRVKLRFTPEIHFKLDESIEKGSKILALIDSIKNQESNSENI